MKKLVAILLAILILFSFFQGALRENVAKANDQSIWPMLQYNAQRTGQCPYDTSKNAGVLKWKFMTKSGFLCSPSAAIAFDGTIYVGSFVLNKLYALNFDGTIKWIFKYEGIGWPTPAIASDGTIYISSSILDYLYVINSDGTLRWKFKVGDFISSSPAIASDGTIYIGSYDSYFYAINPDGTLKWKFKTDDIVRAHAAIAKDGTIYVSSSGNYLYAFNPDGTLKWAFETPTKDTGASISVAIASDGTIYAAGRGKTLYALNPDGTIKWKFETGEWLVSSPAVASDGTIYIGSAASYIATDPPLQDSYLYAINPDGTLKWKFKVDNAIVIASPVIAAEGTVYIGSRDGYLYAINPDGTLKWKFKTGGMIHSTPAIDDKGTVYIGSDDGYLYAIGNYTITSSAGNGGLINPSGNVPVNSGNSQTFTVTPNPGYHIKDVLVDGKSVGPVTTYTFENTTSDHTIEAVFEKNPVITVSYGTNGKVDPSGQITVDYGTSKTFTITPKTGCHVSDVKLDGNSVLNALVDNHNGTYSYTLSNITDNHTIDVSFEINKYKITVSQTPGGTVFPTGNLTVEYGKSYSCMISPVRGYYVKDVLVDGKSTGTTGTSNATYKLDNITSDHTIEVVFGQQTTIILTVGKSTFTINGEQKTLDSTPVIKNNRTLLPIRPVVEALGGSVSWDGNEKKVTISLGSTTIELWIGKNTARVNATNTPIDSTNSKVVPEIINGRTMLPLRFVTENLGCQLQWDPNTKTITITYSG